MAQWMDILENMIELNIQVCFILDKIFDRIRYIIMLKSISYKQIKIEINANDDLTLEKKLNMHSVIILIKSAFNENDNHYCYKFFLENSSQK